jgi:hypothetical protein
MSKYDGKEEKYSDDGKDGGDFCYSDEKDCKDSSDSIVPKIEIISIDVNDSPQPVSDPIDLRITFELDR